MERNPETLNFWRGVLPHWEVVDGHYFVTIRLVNSLPRHVAEDLNAQLSDATEQDFAQRSRAYFVKIDKWLDQNTGSTWLSQPEISKVVVHAVKSYEERGYWHMLAGVIMPNHIHLFFRCGSRSLTPLMQGFKRYTSRRANEILDRKGKHFWQKEWFDHWSRSVQEDDKIVSYIRKNPERAGLVKPGGDWPRVW